MLQNSRIAVRGRLLTWPNSKLHSRCRSCSLLTKVFATKLFPFLSIRTIERTNVNAEEVRWQNRRIDDELNFLIFLTDVANSFVGDDIANFAQKLGQHEDESPQKSNLSGKLILHWWSRGISQHFSGCFIFSGKKLAATGSFAETAFPSTGSQVESGVNRYITTFLLFFFRRKKTILTGSFRNCALDCAWDSAGRFHRFLTASFGSRS